MQNSYLVITKKKTVLEILENDETSMFYGNPFEITVQDINEIIEFFENTEEYEKCAELVKAKKSLEFDEFLHALGVNNGVTMH